MAGSLGRTSSTLRLLKAEEPSPRYWKHCMLIIFPLRNLAYYECLLGGPHYTFRERANCCTTDWQPCHSGRTTRFRAHQHCRVLDMHPDHHRQLPPDIRGLSFGFMFTILLADAPEKLPTVPNGEHIKCEVDPTNVLFPPIGTSTPTKRGLDFLMRRRL
jgi:hypothetical protein